MADWKEVADKLLTDDALYNRTGYHSLVRDPIASIPDILNYRGFQKDAKAFTLAVTALKDLQSGKPVEDLSYEALKALANLSETVKHAAKAAEFGEAMGSETAVPTVRVFQLAVQRAGVDTALESGELANQLTEQLVLKQRESLKQKYAHLKDKPADEVWRGLR